MLMSKQVIGIYILESQSPFLSTLAPYKPSFWPKLDSYIYIVYTNVLHRRPVVHNISVAYIASGAMCSLKNKIMQMFYA